MKPLLTFIVILVLTSLSAAADRPNVLLIYTDDHGWADMGVQGVDPDIRTPHFDQLARDGVQFTRGYVSAPQCVPSRCGVITGRYQQRFGVEDNQKGPLPLSELTIADRLQTAGYINGWVGKSHLDVGGQRGDSKDSRILPDHMPHRRGFTEYFRGELRQYYASHDLQGRQFDDAPRLVTDNRFRVVVQTEAALTFLDRRTTTPDQPWFLYLAWYAPHVPLESPEPWFSQTPENLPLKRRQALAMIAAMDDGLGQIRAKLQSMGQEKNTLIFFISDNGAPLGNSWDGSINLPMVGEKGMLSEGGIRVPFVAAWPGRWPAGVTYDQPVINLDVAATAVAAAGLPRDPRLDGVDLTPFVTGQDTSAPHEALFWRWGSQAAVLEMPYKLIKLGNRPPLLFDVTEPDGENLKRNLAAQHPNIVARLEQRLRLWAAELQPPGLSEDASAFSRRHQGLFEEHRITAATSAAQPGVEANDDTIQGWSARNGTLTIQDGALVLTPNTNLPKNARTFITNSNLDLASPVTVTLRVRAKEAGQGPAIITWRTKQESFATHQSITFDWPTGTEWQEVRVPFNEKSPIIHIRIHPPRSATGIEIQSLEFNGSSDTSRTFQFKWTQ
jgi:arylsulfatase A-like enzyme